MAITFVNSANAQQTAGATLTVSCPAGIQENDLLLAFIFVEDNSDRITSYPSGWTQLINTTVGTRAIRQYVYYKLATSSEPTTYSWTLNASDESLGIIQAFRGVDVLDPIGDYKTSTNTGSTNMLYAPDTTVEIAGNWLVYIAGNAYGTTYTAPSGYSNTRQTRSGTSSGNISGIMCSREYTSPGLVQGVYATSANGDYYIASLVELRQPQTAVQVSAQQMAGTLMWPTITGTALLTASLLAGGLGLFTPSVLASNMVSPEQLEIKLSQFQPSVVSSGNITINFQTLEVKINQPAISYTASLRLGLDINSGQFSPISPSPHFPAIVSLDTLGLSGIPLSPAVSSNIHSEIEAGPVTGNFSLPGISYTASLRLGPDNQAGQFTLFEPLVSSSGSKSIIVDLSCLSVQINQPSYSIRLDNGVVVDPVTGQFSPIDVYWGEPSIISLAVQAGGFKISGAWPEFDVEIIPDTLILSASPVSPTIIGGPIIGLGRLDCYLSLPNISVHIEGGLPLDTLSLTGTLFEPTTFLNSNLVVGIQTGAFSLFEPAVKTGARIYVKVKGRWVRVY